MVELTNKFRILEKASRISRFDFFWIGAGQPHNRFRHIVGLAKEPRSKGRRPSGWLYRGVREATYLKEHCAATEVKVLEIGGAVRRTLEGMPEYPNMPASWTVIAALQARWPCPGKDKK